MKVVTSLEQIPELQKPIALTIGVFDGVHLGHQQIVKELHKATRKGGSRVLLTFSNHPSTYLNPNSPVPLLNTLKHRLLLLSKLDLDLAIVLPFEGSLANQSYEVFFDTLRKHLPFDTLIVGEDARFGKGRAGGPNELKALGISANFLEKETHHKEIISSGIIRRSLETGELKKAKKMLGRPYSILLPFDKSNVIREDEVQFKWVTGAKHLCLLPSGVYAVDLVFDDTSIKGIALYHGTQTINQETELTLTLIFEKEVPNIDSVEIVFIAYLQQFGAPAKTDLLYPAKLKNWFSSSSKTPSLSPAHKPSLMSRGTETGQ